MHLLSQEPLSQINRRELSSSSCYLAHSCHSGVVGQIFPTYRSGNGLRKRQQLSWGHKKDGDWAGQLRTARLNPKEKVTGERWAQSEEIAAQRLHGALSKERRASPSGEF